MYLDEHLDCVTDCGPKRFADDMTKTCGECSLGCATCDSADLCFECEKGNQFAVDSSDLTRTFTAFTSEMKCKPCGIEFCEDCAQDMCLKCKSGLFIDVSGNCIVECPLG
jgi:hypothetical protein